MNPKEVVRRGYDKVSHAYRDESGRGSFPHDYAAWLSELTPLVPEGSHILDLGCGCGLPVAQTLAGRYEVTGLDISPVQIERARRSVPQARFICADMTEVDFAPRSFAAVVSFFAVIHLPLAEQPALFARLRRWLQPGGYLLLTVGSKDWTGVEENWLNVAGATMFWSHADAETYQTWLVENGFDLHLSRFIPEGDGGHTLILARARSDA